MIEEKIAKLCKQYHLEDLGLLFMESLLPFRRIIGHIVVFGEPFLSIFLNDKIVQEVYDLFYNQERYNKLYSLLKNIQENR